MTRNPSPASTQTFRGTRCATVSTGRITLCPKSAAGSNMHGQPPSMTVMPCSRPYDVAAGDTYIERTRDSQQPVMLNYTFGTVPALHSWSDGTQQATVTYPVPSDGEGLTGAPDS